MAENGILKKYIIYNNKKEKNILFYVFLTTKKLQGL